MNFVPLALLMGTLITPIQTVDFQIPQVRTPLTAEVEITIDEEDLRLMSSIIYAEAGNQCLAGQQAVGIVVMNRSESELFANGVHDVIYQKGQFTPTQNGALDKALRLYDNDSIPSSCIEAAEYALQGNKIVEYNGAVIDLSDYFFFSRKLAGSRLTIQDHQFK